MLPYSNSRFEWPVVVACLAVFVVVLMLSSCSLDSSGDGAPHGTAGASAADEDGSIELRAESTFCSVLQMQSWVNANYPSAYGWTRTYSGNNGTATLKTDMAWCGWESDQKRFNAGSCGSGSCTYDVQDCALGCNIQSCTHSYTLKCTCAPNQCQVLP